MTVLDKFVAFVRGLPADRLESIEEVLADIMQAWSPGDDFTPQELAEIDRRLADDHDIADQAEIEALLGRKLP